MLVYSHRPEVREAIITAVGRRPAPDVGRVQFLEASGIAEVLAAADAGEVDLAILDGEAQPTGGMGVSRQLKNEIDDCPPIIVTVRRRDDRWLATWSQADAVLVHPLDPLTAAETVASTCCGAPRPRTGDVTARLGRRADAVADTSTDRHGGQTWPGLLGRLLAGTDLGADDTAWVMDRVLSGEATAAQLAGFLVALRAKGEAAGRGRRARRGDAAARAPGDGRPARRWTSSGTGGDQARTVNISTMAAVVVAAAGVPVVKHGNRAASSASGAADVLEALGVAIDLPPDAVAACVEEAGIGFCFAPVFHPAMRHTGPGPPRAGRADRDERPRAADQPRPAAGRAGRLRRRRGWRRCWPRCSRAAARPALVVRGDDGLDELTTTTTSTAWVVGGGEVRQEVVDPAALGVAAATRDDLRGGDAAVNAAVFRRVLAGERGPVRDAVLLNAAGALVAFDGVAAGPPADLAGALSGALVRAAQAVDSGAGEQVLARWVEVSTRLRGSAGS